MIIIMMATATQPQWDRAIQTIEGALSNTLPES